MSVSLPFITTATAILIGCQALVLVVDERFFHLRRGLGRWERWGHPVDTVSVLLPVLLAATTSPTSWGLGLFTAASVLSCLCVTKDEFVHAKACKPAEHWLHALLFLVHAPILMGIGLSWWLGASPMLIQFYAVALAASAIIQFYRALRAERS